MENCTSRFIFILVLLNIFTDTQGARIFDVTVIKSCDDTTAVLMTNSTKHVHGKNNRTMEMHFTVKKEIKTFFGVTTLVKCDLSGSQNSCEYFVKDFKTGDLCLKLNQKGQAWSSLIDAFDPKLECPIKPGNYKAEYQLSEDVFKFVPVPTGIWKSTSQAYDGDELVYCSHFEVKIVQRR
ncbi:uncharacterized protein LOC123671150 [Harmonia axyridis]|uniref:uncharacterized protein LOC123671150 n=1 Tax=Harmonia axyridis TaxID=115357 RepID=UPI001E277750|nr:uncharacterized protein LOC123671150 [Harmonia axyridis]